MRLTRRLLPSLPLAALPLAALLLTALPLTAIAQTRDLVREEANRRLVVEFYEAVFIHHDLTAADRFLSEGYIQHNPLVPDGRAAFVAVFTRVFAANPQASSRIIRTATDGDLVWLHSHSRSSPTDRGRAIVDIFRVQGDRITEHWDVIQPVPETAANANTMF